MKLYNFKKKSMNFVENSRNFSELSLKYFIYYEIFCELCKAYAYFCAILHKNIK